MNQIGELNLLGEWIKFVNESKCLGFLICMEKHKELVLVIVFSNSQ